MKQVLCNTTELIPRLGGLFCAEKLLVGFILKRKGFSIDPDAFIKSELDNLIKQDKLVGTVKFFTVENNNQEADYATSVRKERRKTISGTKGYRFTFDKGSCFQNEIDKLDGSQNYEFIPVFEDGSALFAVLQDGKIKGFDCNLFTGIREVQTTADVAGSILEVDIVPDAMYYWQKSSALYKSDDFSFSEIMPVAGLNIKLPILVAAATSTTAKVTNLCSDAVVSGLTTLTNWKLERNGVLEPFTGSITEVNGNYTFTHAALVAGDKIRIMTQVSGYPVYVLDTSYYAGVSNMVTVA